MAEPISGNQLEIKILLKDPQPQAAAPADNTPVEQSSFEGYFDSEISATSQNTYDDMDLLLSTPMEVFEIDNEETIPEIPSETKVEPSQDSQDQTPEIDEEAPKDNQTELLEPPVREVSTEEINSTTVRIDNGTFVSEVIFLDGAEAARNEDGSYSGVVGHIESEQEKYAFINTKDGVTCVEYYNLEDINEDGTIKDGAVAFEAITYLPDGSTEATSYDDNGNKIFEKHSSEIFYTYTNDELTNISFPKGEESYSLDENGEWKSDNEEKSPNVHSITVNEDGSVSIKQGDMNEPYIRKFNKDAQLQEVQIDGTTYDLSDYINGAKYLSSNGEKETITATAEGVTIEKSPGPKMVFDSNGNLVSVQPLGCSIEFSINDSNKIIQNEDGSYSVYEEWSDRTIPLHKDENGYYRFDDSYFKPIYNEKTNKIGFGNMAISLEEDDVVTPLENGGYSVKRSDGHYWVLTPTENGARGAVYSSEEAYKNNATPIEEDNCTNSGVYTFIDYDDSTGEVIRTTTENYEAGESAYMTTTTAGEGENKTTTVTRTPNRGKPEAGTVVEYDSENNVKTVTINGTKYETQEDGTLKAIGLISEIASNSTIIDSYEILDDGSIVTKQGNTTKTYGPDGTLQSVDINGEVYDMSNYNSENKRIVTADGSITQEIKFDNNGTTIISQDRYGTNSSATYDHNGNIVSVIIGSAEYVVGENNQLYEINSEGNKSETPAGTLEIDQYGRYNIV